MLYRARSPEIFFSPPKGPEITPPLSQLSQGPPPKTLRDPLLKLKPTFQH